MILRCPVQHPDRPAERHTRDELVGDAWWCGANIAPIDDITTSNDSSANGRFSASASTQSSSTPSASARARPASKRSGVRSLAVTAAPAWAAGIEAFPCQSRRQGRSFPGRRRMPRPVAGRAAARRLPPLRGSPRSPHRAVARSQLGVHRPTLPARSARGC